MRRQDFYIILSKTENQLNISKIDDYHSHNTKQLSIDEIKEKLLSLSIIEKELLQK